MSGLSWLLKPSFSHRIRRRQYWLGVLVWQIAINLSVVALSIAANLTYLPKPLAGQLALIAVIIACAAAWIYALVMFVSLIVRRLHDLNKSGLWGLLMMVPFVCAIVFIGLGVLPAKSGQNNFGPRQYPFDDGAEGQAAAL
ncbi:MULTISPECIES: DUF805 domain-containing protein [unclassified Brevundimonas]|uniref:DUF805 domain-containing protein n=1 Tax=unclassified Brevundimonas TaxID=2622653 RepID=UPI0025B94FF6|nr:MULTISPECIES: DUF805 domain-containing protein [unclassified Brevundimonas]